MQQTASELLLLVTNLSQLRSLSRVKSFFTEGISEIFKGANAIWHEENKNNAPSFLPVCTRNNTYGYIEFSQLFLSEQSQMLPYLQNAVQLLALIFERIEQENDLKDRQEKLQTIIQNQTQSLIEKNDELNETNEELATANEELIESNHSLIETNNNLHLEIEKRKALEKKLRESDKFFKRASDMLCIAGFDGYFKLLNPAWEKILGWSTEEMLSKPWNEFVHPDDLAATDNVKATIVGGEQAYSFENRYLCKNGEYKWLSWNSYPQPEEDLMFGVARDITSFKESEKRLKQIEWMLNSKPLDIDSEIQQPGYGDLTRYNKNGLIINSIDKEVLSDITSDYLSLLETSSAIYEKNGDYAMGIFSSGWCRFMDDASRKLCNTKSNTKALKSGKWLCHESCWTDASKKVIETGKVVDIKCNGGLNLYAEPIIASNKVVGAINFGYGNPPTNEIELKELAEKYQVDYTELLKLSKTYETRPPFIIELAKKRLKYSARQIGTLIERKQAEDKLKESEDEANKLANLLETLFDAIPDIIGVQDTRHKILRYNEAGYRLLKTTPENANGKHCYELIGRNTPCIECATSIALKNKKSAQIEKYLPESDIWFDVRAYPVFNSQGDISYVIEHMRDITEKKKAETQIKESEERYRTLIDFAPDAFFQGDKSGNFIRVNKKSTELTGYGVDELLKMNMSQLFSEPELSNNPLRYDLLLKGETVISERNILCKDGKSLLVEMNSRMLPDGTLQSFVRNITERRKTEEQLRTLTMAINQSPNSVVITDKKGIIQYVNPVIEKLSGYTKEELIGENPRIFASGKTSKKEYKKLWDTITSGNVWQGEFQNKKKNGELFWESATISPVFDGNGIITHYLAIREDITRQKKMTQELIEAKERAEESDRLKSSFLANMSHEIRTPMNSIMGFSSLLPEEESKELMCNYANIIVKNSEQLVHIIDDIVLYSRLQTRLLQNIPSEFSVCDLINDVTQSFNLPEFTQKGIDLLSQNETGQVCMIKTDYDKLRQIFTNLVSNAFKYTHTGSITLGMEFKDKQLCFFVKDTGIGIPDNEKEKVFERFYRGSNVNTGAIGGTGLGLSIVKELVELLGGKIWIESNPDGKSGVKGSTFYFTVGSTNSVL